MKITNISIRKVNKEDSRMKGIASVLLDDEFAVHDIRIIEGTKGLFIAMPSRKTSTGGFKDIAHPISQEVRSMFEREILDAYEKAEDTVETGILFMEIIPEKQWKIIVNTIYFDPDRATFNKISAEQRKANTDTLDSIAYQLSLRENVNVVVQGYANNVSNTERENIYELIPLSQLRANTIMELLIQRGIDSSILESEGLGGANPIAAWEDRANWWKNRRVEFIVTKIDEAE